jgi:hypothetical protein
MTMRLRPAGVAAAALLVMTACSSGGAVATTETTTTSAPGTTSAPTTSAPTTSEPGTTTVPTTLPTPPTILDTDTAKVLETDEARIFIAHAFFDARNAYDVEAATALFGPEVHVHDERDFITGVDTYPALFEWLQATGWKWTDAECDANSVSQYNVACSFHVENAWSRAMGLAPVADRVNFEIWGPMDWVPDFKVDQDDSASGGGGPNLQMVEVWETVTDWIRANYPSDAGAMISEDGSGPVLDARSIDLWRLYTQEFVEFHAA